MFGRRDSCAATGESAVVAANVARSAAMRVRMLGLVGTKQRLPAASECSDLHVPWPPVSSLPAHGENIFCGVPQMRCWPLALTFEGVG